MHQRLSPYSRLPRLALACGAIVWAFPETHAMVPQRIAVCELGQHEDTPRLGAHCTDALRREGHTTTRLDPASLSNTDVLSPAHLDCVVLLRSSKIPAAAAKPLSAFARAGGDLVLLGEFNQRRAGLQIPLPPGCNNCDIRLQPVDTQLKSHLVITLTGGTMSDCLGACLVGNVH